jgi:hypothetical protein
MRTPPPQDEERSFLITLKFGRDIAELGIVEESQVSVIHTISIWLMETTTHSPSILEAIERTLEMRRLGRQRFPIGGGGVLVLMLIKLLKFTLL